MRHLMPILPTCVAVLYVDDSVVALSEPEATAMLNRLVSAVSPESVTRMKASFALIVAPVTMLESSCRAARVPPGVGVVPATSSVALTAFSAPETVPSLATRPVA